MGSCNHVRRIDLAQLRENLKLIRKSVPDSAKLLAVVKADAYGHGSVMTAREAEKCGVDYLAVALCDEGRVLRMGGVQLPILVLGAVGADTVATGVAYDLTLTVCTPEMVRLVEEEAQKQNKIINLHIKIDSGMCRIGCRTMDDVNAVVQAIQNASHVKLVGAFTHFADADGEDMAFTHQQYERFLSLTEQLPEGIIRHCCNSAAIHRCPEMALDMVRAGITMYGYPPVEDNIGVKPWMRWQTGITHVKEVQPGDTVSYGRTWESEKVRKVATLAVGYGDGYHRAMSGKAHVIIRGHRVPVIGRICMDQMMADVTDIPEVQPGDIATLMGSDGDETITAEDLAKWAGTISYEILLAATGRVHREWDNALE